MRVVIIASLHRPHSHEIVRQTVARLRLDGHMVCLPPELAHAMELPACEQPLDKLVEEADIVIAVGGDGTMLGATRMAAPAGVPVLGVNAGALGFLTELTPKQLPQYLPRIMKGEYEVEARMMLQASVMRGDNLLTQLTALNDIVIRQGAQGRLIHLDMSIAGHMIGHLAADGLIVSTPTGSTAYNLAAGGPIMHPAASVITLTPICPHSLTFRPMAVPASDPVEVLCQGNQHGDEMALIADGQEPFILAPQDRVVISPAAEHALFVKLGLFSFYDRLREKFQWGAR